MSRDAGLVPAAGREGALDTLMAVVEGMPLALPALGALVAWGISSLVEFNASIFLAAATMFSLGLVAARVVNRRGGHALALFTLAYLLRTLAALLAYYSGKGEAYWVGGAGSDAIAYYNTSFLDLGEALFEFSYKGFVTYNSYVTKWALAFDAGNYLCNLQGPVVAGAVLVALVYAVVRELRDDRTAFVVALILTLHPSLIAISAVLLRDSLVGVFGWATMLALVRLFQVRSVIGAVVHLAVAAVVVVILSYLRLQSMIVFVGLALAALFFTTRATPSRGGLPPRLRRAAMIGASGAAAAGVVLMLAGGLPAGFDASYFKGVVEYRIENAAQGSLGVALASSNIVVSTVMYGLLAMLTPFPFYAWSPDALGHPTAPLDYLNGLGGLANQLLLAFAVAGLASAARRRDAMTLAWIVCIVGFVALTVLGGGDTVRYIAVHVFPLYLMIVVDGMRVVRLAPRTMLVWAGMLTSLYAVYETLKNAVGQDYVLLAGVVFASYFVAYALRMWVLSGAAHPASRGRQGERDEPLLHPTA